MNTQIEIPQAQVLDAKLQSLDAPSAARRNGKIARLPKPTRDMINHMLDDGLPYHVIIDELGEAGEGLNAQNLTNWKQGGYQDWLKHQELIERVKAQVEAATDLLRETGNLDTSKIYEACHLVAAVQLFDGLLEYGEEALKKILMDKPATYISLLNVVCNLANSGLRYDKHRLLVSRLLSAGPSSQGSSSQFKPDQGPLENAAATHPFPAAQEEQHAQTSSSQSKPKQGV